MELTWQEILLRIILAAAIGFVFGMEREWRRRPAGIKTHIIVCVGAAVISLVQLMIIAEVIAIIKENPDMSSVLKSDFGRLPAQVISGIGFIGAGCIIREKGTISGITTAATLWFIACIGLVVGMGYYRLSIISSIATFIILTVLRLSQRAIYRRKIKKKDELSE